MNSKAKKINLYLRTYEQIYGNYYMNDNPHLDMELINHLLLLASSEKSQKKLELHVWQKEIEDADKFKLALTNSFRDLTKEINKEFRSNFIIAIISILVGILVGILATLLSSSNQQFSSIVIIAFWVFVWYAVETAIFDNVKLMLKKRRFKQISQADVYFQKFED